MTSETRAGHRDVDQIPLFDCDSHVTEPTDLWTKRLAHKYDVADLPHVGTLPGQDVPRWIVGKQALTPIGKFSLAGWHDYPPSHPLTLEEADKAAWDPGQRLLRMDEYGVDAQVMYPNIIAFSTKAFMELGPELSLDCVKAYNDFSTEFASEDPKRLVPIMMLPFWNMDEAVKELERCVKAGHKGILLASQFQKAGFPELWEDYWTPLLEAAQHHEMSINFHIGFAAMEEEDYRAREQGGGAQHARLTSANMINNARAIVDIITTGLCHNYPDLKFVSVESGVGWFQYLEESLDWHWHSYGAYRDHPERELPSFYLHRQVYGSFWFEQESVRRVADLFADNIMFETDFPHPTSLSPGPASIARRPADMARDAVAGLPLDLARKLLYENGAKLYHLL